MSQILSPEEQEAMHQQTVLIAVVVIVLGTLMFGFIAFLALGSQGLQSDSGLSVFSMLIISILVMFVIIAIIGSRINAQSGNSTNQNIAQKQREKQMYNQIKTQQDRLKFAQKQGKIFSNDSMRNYSDSQTSYRQEERGIFGKNPLRSQSGDLLSKVCKKCYSALDANGKCPQCSFK